MGGCRTKGCDKPKEFRIKLEGMETYMEALGLGGDLELCRSCTDDMIDEMPKLVRGKFDIRDIVTGGKFLKGLDKLE